MRSRLQKESVMPEYRVYEIDKNDRVMAPAQLVTCENDEDAIRQVTPLVDAHDVELWQDRRKVCRIRST
jgi:hypothetical protein